MVHIRRSLLTIAFAALTVALLPGSLRPAYAAPYLVTTLADSGPGSLRQAMLDANAAAGADTITFSVSGTITLSTALPDVTDPSGLTIDGTGQAVVVSGNDAVRPFRVEAGAVAEVRGLTIEKGAGLMRGGGIDNSGQLTITNSNVKKNTTALAGGGIFNDSGSTLVLSNSTVEGNATLAPGNGGGIYIGGFAIVTSSTISANDAGNIGTGGGIANGGTLILTNSTVSGNLAGGGGGIINGGSLTLTNSTVTGNNATAGFGGGISSDAGSSVVWTNALFSGNTSTTGGADCNGTITATGPNLVSSLTGCTVVGIPPIAANPLLGPLANNGGPTPTHALLAGSVAAGRGDPATCAGTPVNGVDQRGVVRPQGPGCDLGAFESNLPLVPLLLANGDFEGGAAGWTLAGMLDGIARIETEGACFGANNTMGITFSGNRALNVRSSPSAPVGSVGVATSNLFTLGSAISFRALIENDDAVPAPYPVNLEARILNGSAGLLSVVPLVPNILTTSPGTSNDGCLVGDLRDGPWSTHTIDTSAYAGQIGRIEFRQHTNVPGKGFFALVDDVVVTP